MVRAGAGPVRDLWLAMLQAWLPLDTPIRRMPTSIADDRLLGGLDLAATLRAGRPIAQSGLLAEADGGVIVVPMAERLSAGTVARLCAAIDTGGVSLERDGLRGMQPARFGLVLLDEGGEDEAVAEALADRLAFRADLTAISWRDIDGQPVPAMPTRRDQSATTALFFPHPRPEVAKRREGLEEGLQPAQRRLEPSCEAATGAMLGGDGGFPPPCREEPEMGVAPLDATEASGATPTLDPSPEGGGKALADPIATLCAAAADLGIVSLRGPLLAARVARFVAWLDHRDDVTEADVIEAARLVLAPRATRVPAASEPTPEAPGEPEEASSPDESGSPLPPDDTESEGETTRQDLDEIVLEAARAAIPPNLLAQLLAAGPRLRDGKAGRMGAAASAPRSGRPAGSRPGDPRRGRLDLIATLRAAAPWQRLRRGQEIPEPDTPSFRGSPQARIRNPESPTAGEAPILRSLQATVGGSGFRAPLRGPGMTGAGDNGEHGTRRIIVLPDDLRIKRLRQRTETTTIFCVDASGSAALERLAETKGAVELLLAESYVRRDRVALVAFRGTGAEVVLPPTRSLARAKRVLGGLPGGGGTPLAAGIDAAATLALSVRRGGGSPVIVLLTDGRANVARSGEGGRARAGEEALAAGRLLKGFGLRTLLIDTGARPDGARRLADVADARYIPLPYADAGGMSAAVRAAIG